LGQDDGEGEGMGVSHDIQAREISKDEYHGLDYVVMGLAFELHNEFGRFHDERVYRNELVNLCRGKGLTVRSEVPLHVSCGSFSKTLYMDMLVEAALVYEIKTIERLVACNRQQTLNYLLLAGMKFGKLVNFRPSSVEHEYVTTTLDRADRFAINMIEENWRAPDDESRMFKDVVATVIGELGLFLGTDLYVEAIVSLLGGEQRVLRRINVVKNGQTLGSNRVQMLNSETAFAVSAVTRSHRTYESHLGRYYRYTGVKELQWVNLSRHDVTFKTVNITR
jgi:GxxExxY protein